MEEAFSKNWAVVFFIILFICRVTKNYFLIQTGTRSQFIIITICRDGPVRNRSGKSRYTAIIKVDRKKQKARVERKFDGGHDGGGALSYRRADCCPLDVSN